MSLTQTQRDFYKHNGYLANVGKISPDLLRDLKRELDESLSQTKTLSKSDDKFDFAPDHTSEQVRCRRVREPYRFMESFQRLLTCSEVLDVVESLLGEDIYFRDMPLNMKPPSTQCNEIGWHQDWAFEPLSNDNALTITVALCDCTIANGALRIIPGTHNGNLIFDHHIDGYFTGCVDPQAKDIAWDEEVIVECEAGTINVHHCRVLHGSGVNETAFDRPVQAIGFCAGDAWPLTENGELWDQSDLEKHVLRGALQRPRFVDGLTRHAQMPRKVNTNSLFDLQQSTGYRMG